MSLLTQFVLSPSTLQRTVASRDGSWELDMHSGTVSWKTLNAGGATIMERSLANAFKTKTIFTLGR